MDHPHEHPAESTQAPARKLHQDWRLWLMVILMLVAMAIYILTLNLR
jgi:hypothetical protein